MREKTVRLVSTVTPVVDQIAEEVQELVHASLPRKNGMTSLYFRDGGIGGTRVAFDEAATKENGTESNCRVSRGGSARSFDLRAVA